MALPPTGEPFGGGLAGPGAGRRSRAQGPTISVDPNTVTVISRVREAVRSLKSEMKGLADQAERYARAMGQKATGWGAGGRPANFPEPPGQRQQYRDRQQWGRERYGPDGPGGGGGGGGRGGFFGSPLGIEAAVLLQPALQLLGRQIADVVQRERVTTRLAMGQTGAYTGYGQAQPWQRMLRGATGYSSTGDLYTGAGTLGQAGLMRAPNDARTQQLVKDTGLISRVTGTNFSTAAQIEAGFRQPGIVNALRQGMIGGRSITTPFAGGGLQMFGQKGQGPGLLEQIYGGFGGNRRSEDFYRTGLAPGGALARTLGFTGMSAEQQDLVKQYGIARAERATTHPQETEQQQAAAVQKELSKRYKDTGEDLRELQAAWADMKDLITTGLVPVIKALNTALRPLVGAVDWLNKTIPQAQKVFGMLIGALIAWQIKVRVASALAGTGLAGRTFGALGGTSGAAGIATGMAGKIGAGLGYATLGMVGGEVLQSAVGGEHGTARSRIGGALGGAARGAGVGAAVGGVLGGGVLSWASAPLGAAVGGVLGGIWGGARGDAWPEWMREGVGDGEATNAPGGQPASGAALKGAKASDANMSSEFVKKLQAMFADNPNLSLTSGWRDPATQARLYREKPNLAAPPGHSNHEKGLAADIGPPSEYAWISANMGKYGLFLPMPDTNERRAKKKKIEPWHVESTGSLAPSVPATPTTAATGTAPTKTKAVTASTGSPEVSRATAVGGNAYQEANAAAAVLGGSQIGDAWESGDNTVVFPYTTGGGVQTGGSRGGSITIGRIVINLTIARGTPEEAERTARYLGTLLGDRERMLSLARGSG